MTVIERISSECFMANYRIVGNIIDSSSNPMIPPVQMNSVWGRAQSSQVQMEDWTGLDNRLSVLDCTGLVWTSPHTLTIITLFHSQLWLRRRCIITFHNYSRQNYDSSACIFGTVKIYFSHSTTDTVRNIPLPCTQHWTDPHQSSPVQFWSNRIGDWSEPGPKFPRTGLDWWNHCQLHYELCVMHGHFPGDGKLWDCGNFGW